MSISNVKNPTIPVAPAAPKNTSGAASAGASSEAAKTLGAAAASAPTRAAAAGGYAKTAATPTTKEAAAVSISPRAKEMSLARAVVDSTPEVREDKVDKYKKLIASGEYKPDAGKIADGILNEAIKDEMAKAPEATLE